MEVVCLLINILSNRIKIHECMFIRIYRDGNSYLHYPHSYEDEVKITLSLSTRHFVITN